MCTIQQPQAIIACSLVYVHALKQLRSSGFNYLCRISKLTNYTTQLIAKLITGMLSQNMCICVHACYKMVMGRLILQIHANCRIRRVYFSDRLYSEDELPAEFKLYLPVQNKTPGKVMCPICQLYNNIIAMFDQNN